MNLSMQLGVLDGAVSPLSRIRGSASGKIEKSRNLKLQEVYFLTF